jgi:hypothetical protein
MVLSQMEIRNSVLYEATRRLETGASIYLPTTRVDNEPPKGIRILGNPDLEDLEGLLCQSKFVKASFGLKLTRSYWETPANVWDKMHSAFILSAFLPKVAGTGESMIIGLDGYLSTYYSGRSVPAFAVWAAMLGTVERGEGKYSHTQAAEITFKEFEGVKILGDYMS